MIDFKKVFEDAMVAGGDAGGGDVVAPSTGIGANDVLGHCDHKSDGYFSGDPAGCFHIPSKCKVPFKRYEICNGGGKKKKKKKTFYDKGMQIIVDSELTRDMILNLHKVRESAIRGFVLNNWGEQVGGPLSDTVYIEAICYHPMSKSLFLKVEDTGEEKTWFCVADFDEKKSKFIPTENAEYWSNDIMTATQAKQEFKKILNMKGNSPLNKGSDNMRLWVVWGSLY